MLAKLFGANWSTSLFGGLFVLSLFIVEKPELISAVVNPGTAKTISAWAALVSGIIAFWQAKSKYVTGGTVQQTVNGTVAAPGTQNLVDATVLASQQSGEQLTPEQHVVAGQLAKSNQFPTAGNASAGLSKLIVVGALLAGIAASTVGLTSCQTPTAGAGAKADPVVVNAEKTIKLAKDTIDTLEHMEYTSYATLKEISPDSARQIRLYVNTLRRKSHDWLQTAFNAKQAYKLNRTADKQADLNTALAVLKTAIAESEKYMAQIKSKTSASNKLLSKGKHFFARIELLPLPAIAN